MSCIPRPHIKTYPSSTIFSPWDYRGTKFLSGKLMSTNSTSCHSLCSLQLHAFWSHRSSFPSLLHILNRVHLCQGTTFLLFEGFTDAGLIQDQTAEYSGVTGLVTCVTSSLSRNRLRCHFSNNISQLGTWVGPGFVFVLHIVLHSDFD